MGRSVYFFYYFFMSKIKAIALSGVALSLSTLQAFADGTSMFGGANVDTAIQGGGGTADTLVQRLVANAMLFLGIVAVLYGIWGGFLMVTAGGDEEKVKKGRTILIQVAIGLVVIFVANSIVQFVLSKILV